MIVIPLVVASLLVGTASLGDLTKLGRIGGKTLAYYMLTTAVAVTIGLALANVLKPGAGVTEETRVELTERYGGDAASRMDIAENAPSWKERFCDNPRSPVQAAANMDLLPYLLRHLLWGGADGCLARAKTAS